MTRSGIITGDLKRLRKLLADYSHRVRRTTGMLAEIDALLVSALREAIPPGASARKVRTLLGPPHMIIGGKSGTSFRWLYPSACSAAEADRAPEWFFVLIFKDGKLRSVDRAGWSD